VTLTYGLLSTYPPTACGLATFTSALAAGISASSERADDCVIVRSVESPGGSPVDVVAELVAGSVASRRRAIDALNDTDVVIIQHEYGIFGGEDGDEVLDVIEALTVPVIVVLHTVPLEPSAHQRSVLEAVVGATDIAVTMTHAARRRLAAGYKVDMTKVSVIPHGAHVAPRPAIADIGIDRPTILTWGLIGPGKGIEWGIEALALLGDLRPRPRYLVVGKTHPKVLAAHGEAYRSDLQARAGRLGLSAEVEFDATYLDVPSLQRIVGRSTLVLLPYDSTDQITSGVLIDAVAAGKPVISTRFPHAVELLGGGVGLLVAHRDPTAIAEAVRRVITNARLRETMATSAEHLAPGLAWTAVADRYRTVAEQLVARRAAAVA
jgi:glycosyltransferase involved in cell wall biosynthesis